MMMNLPFWQHDPMYIPDDLNNCRIRQLIEQFNAEETYGEELRSAIERLRKLLDTDADLAHVIAALRRARWVLPMPPAVNAIGIWIES